jgi:aspartate-semialdehyde dehydrogenase
MSSQIKVGILGATGTVGQKFIALLEKHPFLKVHALGASPRSAGQAYHKATKWKQPTPIPSLVRDMVVSECKPEHFSDCGIVFSGLDASVAGDIGKDAFATRHAVLLILSNRVLFLRRTGFLRR